MRSVDGIQNRWNSTVNKTTKITFNEYPAIVEKYKSGLTLQNIGDEYGVSRERIRQILSLYNLTRTDGGQSTKTFLSCTDRALKRINKADIKEQKCFEKYGCNLEFFQLMRGTGDYKLSPLMKYRNQKHNADTRGVEWNLTLPEWWDIWQKSGHWDERGLGSGKYVMGRLCDMGSYSVDNVAIITHNENSRESREMDFVRGRWQKNNIRILAEKAGLRYQTVMSRINTLGWTLEQAVNTPLMKSKWDKKAA
jgi:hypothetical protein